MADRFVLFEDRLVVLIVFPVSGIFVGRLLLEFLLAPDIDQELGGLPVFLVSGVPEELDQADFLAFVARNEAFFPGP